MSWRLMVVMIALFLPASLSSQQQPYSEQVEVRIRNLDVIVTDRDGHAIRGLKPHDFLVQEDGVEQAVTNFAFYDSGATVAASFDSSSPDATAAVESAPPPRRFMFFIDEMALQGAVRKSLKKSAEEIVSKMRPGDVATVVRPTGAKRIVQDYTGDIEAIRKSLDSAIDDCKLRMTTPAFAEFRAFRRAMETATNSREIAVAKREFAERETERVLHRLGQIRALLATMSREPGKKVFVLITSGLSAQPGRAAYEFDQEMKFNEIPDPGKPVGEMLTDFDLSEAGGPGALHAGMRSGARQQEGVPRWEGMENLEFADFRAQIDDIARGAAADGVTIYALEPEVPLLLDTTSFGVDARSKDSTLLHNDITLHKVVPADMLNQLLHYEGQTLTSLTEKTGGKWFRGTGNVDDVFRQMADDLRTYYSIAYKPQGRDDLKPRRISVKVRNRPELVVRTRTEVVDEPEARDMADRVVAGLLVPYEEDDLAMTVETRPPSRQGKQYEIPFELVLPVEKLKFYEAEDGTYRASVSVHYAAARDEKELLSYGQTEQIVEISARQYAQKARGRYRYSSTITVPRGNIRIVLGVVDTSTKAASLRTVSVEAR